MMLTMDIILPAPRPQAALAKIKLNMLWARAHHIVARVNILNPPTKMGFLPTASDSLPTTGWKAELVRRNAVESQDALFEDLK